MSAPAEPRRRVIVVDTEFTTLDLDVAQAVEVAWCGWRSPGAGEFIPPHTLEGHDPDSLEVNRYHARNLGDRHTWDHGYLHTKQLHEALVGNTLAGANPRADYRVLSRLFVAAGLTAEPWHHRFLDVSAYAGGILGFAPWDLPGLATLCDTVGVAQPTHRAWDDVVAVCNVLNVVAPAWIAS